MFVFYKKSHKQTYKYLKINFINLITLIILKTI